VGENIAWGRAAVDELRWKETLEAVVSAAERLARTLGISTPAKKMGALEVEMVNTWRHDMPHQPNLIEEAPGLLKWLRVPRVERQALIPLRVLA
jgi:hypothetical protein